MGLPASTPAQLDMLVLFGLEKNTPLWFYIFKEADLMEKRTASWTCGSRIVGEVFVGLLKADETSYLATQPNWTPVLPSSAAGQFRMADLLTFAGVVPPL